MQRAYDASRVVDRAFDGTPLYALRGELSCESDRSAVQCHLCGRWYRDLASSHLPRAHQVTASEHRQLVGLRPRHPLQASARSAAQGELLRRRIAAEPRLRAAMAWGRRSRAGASSSDAPSGCCASVRRRSSASASWRPRARGWGTTRADAFRARREQQSNALGYQDLEDFYRRRYRDQRARLVDLAADLGCAESAVRGRPRTAARRPRSRAVSRRALALGAVVVPCGRVGDREVRDVREHDPDAVPRLKPLRLQQSATRALPSSTALNDTSKSSSL
jgi:hypothetical protein